MKNKTFLRKKLNNIGCKVHGKSIIFHDAKFSPYKDSERVIHKSQCSVLIVNNNSYK